MNINVITPKEVDTPFASNQTTNVEDLEIKRLRKTNPLYDVYAREWEFYLSAYEGGVDFMTESNIFRHFRENPDDFMDRLRRVHNLNYCEPLVDFFTNFIFSEAIDRGSDNDEFFLKFVKDVNKRGDTVDDFMRTVSDDTQIFGISYILVDTPKIGADEIVTKYDEMVNDIRPYWVLIKPLEVLDWVTDDFGNLVYFKRKQMTTQETAPGSGVFKVYERYTEFFKNRVEVRLIDNEDPSSPRVVSGEVIPNALGEIPIVTSRYKRSKKESHMGLSFLRDFAYNNREIMNLTSLLQEFLYRQAFNVLTKPTDGSIPMKEQGDSILGTNNVLEYPSDAKPPSYLSPPADPAKFIQDERRKIKDEMYTRAAQDAMSEMLNGEKSSGFSQAQSFSKTVPFISSRADNLERVENQLMSFTYRLIGKEWKGKVKYKDRYEITNLTDALTQLQILLRDFALPSETFTKEELKRMVREFDAKLPSELLVKIQKEIDAMDFKKWQEVQTSALVGRGNSPGEQQKPKDTLTIKETADEARASTRSTVKMQD